MGKGAARKIGGYGGGGGGQKKPPGKNPLLIIRQHQKKLESRLKDFKRMFRRLETCSSIAYGCGCAAVAGATLEHVHALMAEETADASGVCVG